MNIVDLTRRLWIVVLIHAFHDIFASNLTMKMRKIGDISKISEEQFIHYMEQNQFFIPTFLFGSILFFLFIVLFFIFIRFSRGALIK